MAEVPTTGDARADELVRAHFTEAIDVIRQIIVDRHPELVDDPRVGDTSALIAVQVFPILAPIIVEGAALSIAGEVNTANGD